MALPTSGVPLTNGLCWLLCMFFENAVYSSCDSSTKHTGEEFLGFFGCYTVHNNVIPMFPVMEGRSIEGVETYEKGLTERVVHCMRHQ
ncbi:hypothetical protein OROGR_015244 [Orobanche gracilis]